MVKREGIMLATPLDVAKLVTKMGPPYIVQPKLHGIRARVEICDTSLEILSSQKNLITSVPHINWTLKDLVKKGVFLVNELDGEMYVHGMTFDGDNGISSIVKRTRSLHPLYELMQYHIFDVVIDEVMQIDRTKYLMSLLPERYSSMIKIVPSYFLNTPEQVFEMLRSFIEDGYEGIIIRKADAFYIRRKVQTMMKYKPRKQDTYRIVGCREEISKDGSPKNALGAFICEKDGQLFRVGSGKVLTKDQRETYWQRQDDWKSGRFSAAVKYQILTVDRKVPYNPVVVDILERQSEDYTIFNKKDFGIGGDKNED